MWRSWKLGTAFGIGIYIHWTFLLLPAFVLYNNWSRGGGTALSYVLLLLLMTLVFGCVILHELGHALMARHFGIGTRDITLYPIGGVARLERMSERPWEELCIALAGPAVNFFLAALLFFVVAVSFSVTAVLAPGQESASLALTFLGTLLVSNLLLALFNLLPAFPMDGGRVLRALLALHLGQLRATEIAASVGMVLAVVLGAVSIFVMHWPMGIFLAAFVLFAGQAELAALRYREAQRRAQALESVPAAEDIIDAPMPEPRRPFNGYVWDGRAGVWVVWENGQPVGTFGAWSSE